MRGEDEGSIDDMAQESWYAYNPELIDTKYDEWFKRDDNNDQRWADAPVFSIAELRKVYLDAFKAGVAFKITGEIPDE